MTKIDATKVVPKHGKRPSKQELRRAARERQRMCRKRRKEDGRDAEARFVGTKAQIDAIKAHWKIVVAASPQVEVDDRAVIVRTDDPVIAAHEVNRLDTPNEPLSPQSSIMVSAEPKTDISDAAKEIIRRQEELAAFFS